MNLALALFALCGVALLALPLSFALDIVRGSALRRRIRAELERSGLEVQLDPVTLSGVREGVAIAIHYNTTRPLPGKDTHEVGTWLQLTSQGPDLLLCKKNLTDLILGPLPGLSRHSTGDPTFDAQFDILSTDARFDARAFPPAYLRAPLSQLGVQWLRRREGQLEAMLGVLGPNQIASVAEVAVALATPRGHDNQAHYREGPVPRSVTVPASAIEHFAFRRSYVPLLIGFAISLLCGLLGALLLPLAETSHELFAEVACEPGFHPIQTRSEAPDGTYIGVLCEKAGSPNAPTRDLLNWACAALAMSAPLGLGLLFTVLRLLDGVRRSLLRPRVATPAP